MDLAFRRWISKPGLRLETVHLPILQMDWPGLLHTLGVMLRCSCNDSEESSEMEGDIRHSEPVSDFAKELAMFTESILGHS